MAFTVSMSIYKPFCGSKNDPRYCPVVYLKTESAYSICLIQHEGLITAEYTVPGKNIMNAK